MTKINSPHWLIFGLAMLLFAVACACPAIMRIKPDGDYIQPYPGWFALVVGFCAIWLGTIPWLANPLMLVVGVFMFFKKTVSALTTATIGVGCSLTILILPRNLITGHDGDVLLSGSWFWFASIACVWFSSFVAWRNQPRPNGSA